MALQSERPSLNLPCRSEAKNDDATAVVLYVYCDLQQCPSYSHFVDYECSYQKSNNNKKKNTDPTTVMFMTQFFYSNQFQHVANDQQVSIASSIMHVVIFRVKHDKYVPC